MDELHAKNLDDLQTQEPDKDFELIAKYVYARLAEHDPLMKALPKGEYYANATNGLRRFFVNEQGKIRNFKAEGTLKTFIDEYLGFSSYINDTDFSYFYFVQFADLLNSLKTEVHSNVFNKEYDNKHQKSIILNNPYMKIFDKLLVHIKNITIPHSNSHLYSEYLSESNFYERSKLSFLFDVLHYRNLFAPCEKKLKKEFESIAKIYKTSKDKDSRCFILYSIVFIGLYSLKENFNFCWKHYRESEKTKYEMLADLSYRFQSLLSKGIGYNNIGEKLNHIVLLYLLKYLLSACRSLLEEDFRDDTANFDYKLEQLEPATLFLSHMLGGNVIVKKGHFILNLNEESDVIEQCKYLLDGISYNNKLKSDNLKTRDLYKNLILYIDKNNNTYKNGSKTIQHLIYSFFTRAIVYYSQSDDKKKMPKWKLFKLLFNYLPDDFIHGRTFNIDGYRYTRKEFLENKLYNKIHSSDDVASINCYKEYFKLKTNPRYYKSNFIELFAKYNYVSITFENKNETWECNENKYKGLITKSIEDYCDSILSKR